MLPHSVSKFSTVGIKKRKGEFENAYHEKNAACLDHSGCPARRGDRRTHYAHRFGLDVRKHDGKYDKRRE